MSEILNENIEETMETVNTVVEEGEIDKVYDMLPEDDDESGLSYKAIVMAIGGTLAIVGGLSYGRKKLKEHGISLKDLFKKRSKEEVNEEDIIDGEATEVKTEVDETEDNAEKDKQ